MKRLLIVALLLALTSSTAALAQQQVPKEKVQDQLATTYSTISMNLAKQLDAAHDQIDILQKQLADANAKITELTKKGTTDK